jgi:hypothetical protein
VKSPTGPATTPAPGSPRRGPGGPSSPWHWIYREPLSAYEKLLLGAIRSRQYCGRPALLSRQRVAALASITVRKVELLEPQLIERGYLRVTPVARRGRGGRILRLYEVLRVQGDLFDSARGEFGGAEEPRFAPPVKQQGAPERHGQEAVKKAVGKR